MIPSLEIIIVNWNSGNLLLGCVQSINNSNDSSFKLNSVTIVDNASTDNSIDGIENVQLPVKILKNPGNYGFSVACNQAAKNSKSDYLLFLNPDTVLYNNSLNVPIAFLQKLENQNVGIVGVQLINEKNTISRTCSRFPTPFAMLYMSLGLDSLFPKIFAGHFMIEWDHKESKAVDQVMGAFFLVRRNLFEKLNGFDERFFVYYEDLDFSFRAINAGYKTYFLSSAQAFHKGGGTSENVKADRLFFILRSKLLFSKKHFGKFAHSIIVTFTIFLEPIVRIVNSALINSFKDIKEIISAYRKLIRDFYKK